MHKPASLAIALLLLLHAGCQSAPVPATQLNTPQATAAELIAMRDEDQRLNQCVVDGAPEALAPGFGDRKRETYRANTNRIIQIFRELGYPTDALVGADASRAFWLLAQHTDTHPSFQNEVLLAMKPLVLTGEVDKDSLALLTDRVRVNTGRSQVYGTQVEFDLKLGRAIPRNLHEPERVDQRRAKLGLAPLWQYMNDMSEFHFLSNQEYYATLGVREAWTYPAGFLNW